MPARIALLFWGETAMIAGGVRHAVEGDPVGSIC